MRTSEMSITRLLTAIDELHANMKPIRRNRTGGEFDWTDLPAVLRYLGPKLRACDLTVTQSAASGLMQGHVFVVAVTTRLSWRDQWIEDTATCPCTPDRLEYSATVALLRRVGLMTITGLVQREQERAPQDGTSQAQRLVKARQQAAGVGQ